MTFIDTIFEGQNDIVMWQSDNLGIFINCEARRTTTPGMEFQPCNGFFNGDIGVVKLYGCRFTATGATAATQLLPLASNGRMEVYDFVIDYRGQTVKSDTADISVWEPDTMFFSNVRKSDGSPLIYDTLFAGTFSELQNKAAMDVVQLPLHPIIGQIASVKDGANGLAWGATIAAGGTSKYLLNWNGTNWTVMGK